MSDDNNDFESFDFDLDLSNAGTPLASTEEGAFDLSQPIGDDLMGDDLPPLDDGVSTDNPYLNDSTAGEKETSEKKKERGGWFSKKKKETEKKPEIKESLKKEKTEKAEKPSGESVPRDWEMILCIAFSVFLLVSLLMFNIAALFIRGPESTMMQTLCFIGAINLIGLPAAAVPYMFYKFPKERTLPNVMLGIAAVAMLGGLMFVVTDFYRYGFIIKP